MTGGTAIGQNSGSITQSPRAINAGSYVEGNQSQQGVFISGGTVNGPVIGTSSGSVVFGASALAGGARQVALSEVLAQVQAAQGQARDTDLADDLSLVAQALQSALRAESAGKAERRASKLREAQALFDALAQSHAPLQPLAEQLRRIR